MINENETEAISAVASAVIPTTELSEDIDKGSSW